MLKWLSLLSGSLALLCSLSMLAKANTPASDHTLRVALVIGNAAYRNSPLINPVNDARAVAAKLRSLGFQVIEHEDLKQKELGSVLREFRTSLKPGATAIFFYAGHGVQVKGINYLPVVDADISSEEDVSTQSLDLNKVLELMDDAKTQVNLVFLDACRNNPFARSFRSAGDGLAKVTAPSGTIISFATRPGSVAADSGSGHNGLYTEFLLKAMEQGNQPIEQALKQVVSGVKRSSKGKQEPWMEGSIEGDFCFDRCGQPGTVVASLEPVRVQSAEEIEQQLWDSIKDSQDPADFENYLNSYPKGRFAGLARQKKKNLTVVAAPVVAPSVIAAAPAAPLAPSGIIKDCSNCPEMVVIPSGSFMMGSPASEAGRYDDEGPQHQVSMRSYALGKTLVTQGQWRSLMGSNPSEFKNCGDDCPVEQVSWNDAQEYVRKLSAQSGKTYRLPSEAEWEYACRAGQQQLYCGSNAVDSVAWYSGNSGDTTHPVGQKQANAWGLYDMSGNVWEWTQDCYHDSYSGAPSDGSAWLSGSCGGHVLRGGSWFNSPQWVRSAVRDRNVPGFRVYFSGFRVARTLN